MEEGNDRSFELGSSAGVDGGRGERFPDDGLANVGGDEEGDSRAETVALLEELVKEKNDERSGDELDDQEKADSGSKIRGLTVQTGKHVDGGLTESDDKSEN